MATAPDEARPRRSDEGKNIVICCDGTGNEVTGDFSNVLKLFRMLRKDAKQRVFYDPGIGTIGLRSDWARLKSRASAIFRLATGAGLDENILDAYRFLVNNYEPGDRVFLFGFSRGAYTVRALAGFIHVVGLLRPDQLNLCEYALTAFKRAKETGRLSIGFDFGNTVSARDIPIHFIGVWDTVATMIVPRPDRLYLPMLRTLPYTRNNPSVRAFRHAMAIDERRRMFRLNRWDEGQSFIPNRFDPTSEVPQQCKQLWFAGVHSDVGGGFAEKNSALSKLPLIWMIDEAVADELRINSEMFNHLARGMPRRNATRTYEKPDPCAKPHSSLNLAWWILELIPKSTRWRECRRWSLFGWYLPLGEPRWIGAGEQAHPSVGDRKRCANLEYRPTNLEHRGPPVGDAMAGRMLRLVSGAVVALLLLLYCLLQWVTGSHAAAIATKLMRLV